MESQNLTDGSALALAGSDAVAVMAANSVEDRQMTNSSGAWLIGWPCAVRLGAGGWGCGTCRDGFGRAQLPL
jgi:hypothetical protein